MLSLPAGLPSPGHETGREEFHFLAGPSLLWDSRIPMSNLLGHSQGNEVDLCVIFN